jgi:hypothetical protein
MARRDRADASGAVIDDERIPWIDKFKKNRLR